MGKFFLHKFQLEIVQTEVAEDTKLRSIVEGEIDPAKDCVWGANPLPLAQLWCKGAPCTWLGITAWFLHCPGQRRRIGGRGH